MLDIKILREQFETVKKRIGTRGAKIAWEQFAALDQERREALARLEKLKGKKNQLSGAIGKTKKLGGDAASLMKEVEGVAEELRKGEAPLTEVENRFDDFMLRIPNLPHESVPLGSGSQNNKEVRKWGEIPRFDFKAKPHWEIGEELGILDFTRAARITGTRFALYRGHGALLERAVINLMLDLHTRERGYQEILPPFLVNRTAMTGTGQLPEFEEDLFRTADPDFFLIPTAEVPLTNIHREEILKTEDLPIRYVACTACFRKEAGSYGQDVRGLIRQHQFNKVELVKLTEPQTSYEELEKMVQDAEEVLQRLKLPYRIIELCTGDLGFASAKTYDLEVWLAGQSAYREISSCSNCEDFQARRASIRYRPDNKARPIFIHTLNGSGLAVGRTVVAILENYQEKDGSVVIPDALRPYMGGLERIA